MAMNILSTYGLKTFFLVVKNVTTIAPKYPPKVKYNPPQIHEFRHQIQIQDTYQEKVNRVLSVTM